MSDAVERDRQFIWHPYTQHGVEADPILITHAKDASLFTEDGQEILDLISSWWTCLHGHSHDGLSKALAEQSGTMAHIMFSNFTHRPAIDLASALASKMPETLRKVFYSDNGSTAVEVALKLAFQYWKNRGESNRDVFIAFEGGYHGDTLGAMALGRGSGFFRLFEDLMCEVRTVPFAETWANDSAVEAREKRALEALKQTLSDHRGRIAAVVIEPLMQGAGGMRFCRGSFVDAVCELVREAGGLVIFDEVATGFGRTGTFFAFEQTNTQPDVICLSKGLTGGAMPLSVTIADEAVFSVFLGDDFSKALPHGHSFTANPLACAVALKSFDLFEEEKTFEKIRNINRQHQKQIEKLQAHELAEQARVLGTVLAFQLAGPGETYKSSDSLFLRDWYLAHGLNIRPIGSTVYLMPPFCIRDDELIRAYDGLFEGLDALAAERGNS